MPSEPAVRLRAARLAGGPQQQAQHTRGRPRPPSRARAGRPAGPRRARRARARPTATSVAGRADDAGRQQRCGQHGEQQPAGAAPRPPRRRRDRARRRGRGPVASPAASRTAAAARPARLAALLPTGDQQRRRDDRRRVAEPGERQPRQCRQRRQVHRGKDGRGHRARAPSPGPRRPAARCGGSSAERRAVPRRRPGPPARSSGNGDQHGPGRDVHGCLGQRGQRLVAGHGDGAAQG